MKFVIERNGRLFYLVDSRSKRGTFAIRVYLNEQDAEDFVCGRSRDLTKVLFRLWHTGSEDDWMRRLEERLKEKLDSLLDANRPAQSA